MNELTYLAFFRILCCFTVFEAILKCFSERQLAENWGIKFSTQGEGEEKGGRNEEKKGDSLGGAMRS